MEDCSSEPAEHNLRILRQCLIEFTIFQLVRLLNAVKRRNTRTHKHNWAHSPEEEKGCNETLQFYFLSSSCQETSSGPCKVDCNRTTLVPDQKIEHSQGNVTEGCEMMCPLLDLFQVALDRKSPFYNLFLNKDLQDEHFKHSPLAITNKSIAVATLFDNIEALDVDPNNSLLHDQFFF